MGAQNVSSVPEFSPTMWDFVFLAPNFVLLDENYVTRRKFPPP